MSEQRDFYQIFGTHTLNTLIGVLNFIFNRIADRFDAIEGLRPDANEITTEIYPRKVVKTFTQGDLLSGVYTLVHNFGRSHLIIQIYNDSNEQMTPDKIDLINVNTAEIDISSWGDITGKTFTVIAIG